MCGSNRCSGVSRVTIRKNKQVTFVIAKPVIYKSPVSDIFVVFGEAKVEGGNDFAAQMQAASSQFKNATEAAAPEAPAASSYVDPYR